MLYRGRHIFDYTLRATDGIVGQIHDVYFDDERWIVRYLVINTKTWLNRERVLITPQAIVGFKNDPNEFLTLLTRTDVEKCPTAHSHLPLSLQYEEQIHAHYGWKTDWQTNVPSMNVFLKGENDPHLRSIKEICKYRIHATDGDIGEVVDFLIDRQTWKVTHLIATTSSWFEGKQVVIDKNAINEIDLVGRRISLGVTQEDVKMSPKYRYGMTLDEIYLKELSAYYAKLTGISEGQRANSPNQG